jgi:hypothetical protein
MRHERQEDHEAKLYAIYWCDRTAAGRVSISRSYPSRAEAQAALDRKLERHAGEGFGLVLPALTWAEATRRKGVRS